MTRKEELQKELAEIEENEKKSNRDNFVRKLEEVSDEEKISFYDSFFNGANRMLMETELMYREHDSHYSWEDQMSLLQRPGADFWEYYNSLSR